MQGALYLACCLLMWGLAVFAMKWAGSRLDPFTTVVCNTLGYLLMGALLFPRASLEASVPHFIAAAIAVFFVLGNLAFYKLAQTEQISTLAPITGLYTIVPVVLGFVVLHDPITLRKCAGIAFALLAIYLLSSGEDT